MRYRIRSAAVLAVLALTAPAALLPGLSAGVADAATTGSSVGTVRPIACRPSASDPPLEAPLYAQDLGANASPDGWWCQLPHATRMPSGLSVLQRGVAPLPHGYGLYSTTYTEANGGPASIQVSADADGGVNPVNVHGRLPRNGRRVRLGKGIMAAVSAGQGFVSVIWPLPTTGVPAYLKGVATITVQASGVPEGTVLAVARSVRPY